MTYSRANRQSWHFLHSASSVPSSARIAARSAGAAVSRNIVSISRRAAPIPAFRHFSGPCFLRYARNWARIVHSPSLDGSDALVVSMSLSSPKMTMMRASPTPAKVNKIVIYQEGATCHTQNVRAVNRPFRLRRDAIPQVAGFERRTVINMTVAHHFNSRAISKTNRAITVGMAKISRSDRASTTNMEFARV